MSAAAWLVPVDGRAPWPRRLAPNAALLAARLDLDQLLRGAAGLGPASPLLVDIDEVSGLAPDPAAVRFLVRRLSVTGIVTRHAIAATAALDRGARTYLHISALDSTGLERALATHPGRDGMGTAISPGLVLPHLTAAQRDALPRPILAYGLIRTPEDAAACRRAGADVVVRPLTPAPVSG